MRMGILVRRRTVRGPAGMADADLSGDRLGDQQASEPFVDLPLFLAQLEIVVANDRHAGAVIAAIFQPAQPFEDDRPGLLFSYVTNYSTHTD